MTDSGEIPHNADQVPITLCEMPEFRRAAQKFMSEDEIGALCDVLARNPLAGALIPGTGGLRKLRWALAGQGKRGGLRSIYFYQHDRFPLLLVTAYAKSAKENVSAAERNVMAALVAAIRAGRKER